MKLHANARTCPKSRRVLIQRIEQERWSLMKAASAAAVSERTARKWLARWRADGEVGLRDRPSAPKHVPGRLPADRIAAIEKLRRVRMTAAEIAEVLELAISTVSRWLKRIGLGRLGALEPPEPPNRYERKRAGELVHLDIKKLARISKRGAGHRITGTRQSQFKVGPKRHGATGWEFCHVCVDDATRLAYAEVLPDQRGPTAAGFLKRAAAWFASLGVTIERVISDNGSCYRSKMHLQTCRELGARAIFTRPYRPRTNGKAERFIQTLTRRWAHGAIYGSSAERIAALPGWLDYYNYTRGHGSLAKRPPAARLAELEQRHG